MPSSASSRAVRAISRMPSSELSLLLQVSRALGASLDLEDVLQTAIESAVGALRLDTGAIYLLEGDDLVLGATTPPLPPDFPEALRRAPLDGPSPRRAVHRGARARVRSKTGRRTS